MDGYPFHSVAHNLPFVILFGLGSTDPKPLDPVEGAYPLLQEKGIYISSDLPNVTGSAAEELLACFHDFDAKDAAWNNRPGKGKVGTTGFTYRSVGRAFTLPPRKANPPSLLDDALDLDGGRKPGPASVLHSPLSPLTPGSLVFPDGILPPLWFAKHQVLLPSALIAFFNFTSDPNSSTLQDNKLKSEINALKTSIPSSGYRLRPVVVLVCDAELAESSVTERIANIRRGTFSDAKSLFYLACNLSPVETRAFVGTVLASIYPTCIEYYRDLSKHARRKKARGSAPPPTALPTMGTSQILSAQGWNIRYETKLGFFAEFRQEMAAAGSNYESAYESLVDGNVLEGIDSWSPRFEEARQLADTLAIRILRCLLWTGQTTSAVQSWSNHRLRMQDLVTGKGKGSGTYGWTAWEARWLTIMAELIEKVDVPIFHVSDRAKLADGAPSEVPDMYAIPEKEFANEERLPPWDLLHHEGYWLRRAAQQIRIRRQRALAMPKEDRNAPGQSPASHIASRTHLYDTYMCPEPHVEYGLLGKPAFYHAGLLIEVLGKAAHHFSLRQQTRAVERAQFEIACEYMKAEQWDEAEKLLKPIWRKLSWRRAGWWMMVEEVAWAMRACARHLGDGETLVMVEWELMSDCLSPLPGWKYSLSDCLESLDIEDRPHAVFDIDDTAPCITATFAFGSRSGRVGVAVPAQLILSSRAHTGSSPITLSEAVITFEGGLRNVSIRNSTAEDSEPKKASESIDFYDLSISEPQLSTDGSSSRLSMSKAPMLSGAANLTFSPGFTKIFNIKMVPRDAGEVRAIRVKLSVREEYFDLDVNVPLGEQASQSIWWYVENAEFSRRKLSPEYGCAIDILPRPPELEIYFLNIPKVNYTDEHVRLDIQVTNEEDEVADVTIHVQLLGNTSPKPVLSWASEGLGKDEKSLVRTSILDEVHIGEILPSGSVSKSVLLDAPSTPADWILEARADYHLVSDPKTPISKVSSTDLFFVAPFDTFFEFAPCIHPDAWPSYFHVLDDRETTEPIMSKGLKQRWSLATKIQSRIPETISVQSVNVKILEVKYGASSHLSAPSPNELEPVSLGPHKHLERKFQFDIQKLSIDDRRSSVAVSRVEVAWRRESATVTPTTTTFLLPNLSVSFGEPRVLASARVSAYSPYPINAIYMLENPSMHLLTFSVTMEASEEFAFSGPKTKSIQMVPLSRRELHYNLLPYVRGSWIRPVLKVVDVGFGKTLRIWAAEGCKADKKGLAIWVDEI